MTLFKEAYAGRPLFKVTESGVVETYISGVSYESDTMLDLTLQTDLKAPSDLLKFDLVAKKIVDKKFIHITKAEADAQYSGLKTDKIAAIDAQIQKLQEQKAALENM